jgi:hypothetical protein
MEDIAMPEKEAAEPFKVGDWVKIRHSGFPRARIVELRGPLGPAGRRSTAFASGASRRRPTLRCTRSN